MPTPLTVSHEAVRSLLEGGYTYEEVASQLDIPVARVRDRNRVYQVDLYQAYKARLEREGLPNRLTADPDFCHWFTGFFDGEGTLHAFKTADGRRQSAVMIYQRYDDLSLLESIRDTLGVGIIRKNQMASTTDGVNRYIPKLKYGWHVSNVKDLVEYIIPLFDRFPLRSKKGREYVYWRTYVLNQYTATLGGGNPKRMFLLIDREAFAAEQDRLIQEIQTIRHPCELSTPASRASRSGSSSGRTGT